MTQLWKRRSCPHCGTELDAISNKVDLMLRGIGHRGSSFTDVDGLVHDGRTDRFLFMEFKWPGEALTNGQGTALKELALESRITVWYIQVDFNEDANLVGWSDMRWPLAMDVISIKEFRARFEAWWNNGFTLTRGGFIQPREFTHGRTWMERMADSCSLREFVEAEIARAHVELASLRAERDYWKAAAVAATRKKKSRLY